MLFDANLRVQTIFGRLDPATSFGQPIYIGNDLHMSDSTHTGQDLLATKYKLYANDLAAQTVSLNNIHSNNGDTVHVNSKTHFTSDVKVMSGNSLSTNTLSALEDSDVIKVSNTIDMGHKVLKTLALSAPADIAQKYFMFNGYDTIDFSNINITGTGGTGWPAPGVPGTPEVPGGDPADPVPQLPVIPIVGGTYEVDLPMDLNGNRLTIAHGTDEYGAAVDRGFHWDGFNDRIKIDDFETGTITATGEVNAQGDVTSSTKVSALTLVGTNLVTTALVSAEDYMYKNKHVFQSSGNDASGNTLWIDP